MIASLSKIFEILITNLFDNTLQIMTQEKCLELLKKLLELLIFSKQKEYELK